MEIALVRAAFLHVYVDQLREIGVPVERDFAKSGLSPWILEQPDAYVSIFRGLEWLATCSRDMELADFGFLSARRQSLATLSRPLQRAVHDAPTGYASLLAFHRHASGEDNALSIRLQPEGNETRVISEMEGFSANPSICVSEWMDLQVIQSIIQSAVGPSWCPNEITFVSRHQPSVLVQEAFPNTRILTGQPHTSITISSDLLAAPCSNNGYSTQLTSCSAQNELCTPPNDWDFGTALRVAVRPYLNDGYPAVTKIAETFNMSRRTLQRRLQDCGCSYSDVVNQARFELAREMFADPSVRVIDVAMAAGYENPQHFSRAFRRFAGVSPTRYRRSLAEND